MKQQLEQFFGPDGRRPRRALRCAHQAAERAGQAQRRALFPADFVFQLRRAERDEVVANCDHLHPPAHGSTQAREEALHRVRANRRNRAALSGQKKLFSQQTLGSNDPVFKTILKCWVLSPVIDVLRDRGANNLGDGLVFDGRDRRQRVSLLGRQPNSHGFGWLHGV